MELCKHVTPDWAEVEPGHFCACHLYNSAERTAELEREAEELKSSKAVRHAD
jgi:hypothetical protein